MDSRRDFFRSLVAGGASVSHGLTGRHLNHRTAGVRNERLYHGPMEIPTDVAEAIRESPDLSRTRHTGGVGRGLCARYTDADGVRWRMLSAIGESRQMVGEIVRTAEGAIRVHCWTIARPGEYRDARAIIARHTPTPPPVDDIAAPDPTWTPADVADFLEPINAPAQG